MKDLIYIADLVSQVCILYRKETSALNDLISVERSGAARRDPSSVWHLVWQLTTLLLLWTFLTTLIMFASFFHILLLTSNDFVLFYHEVFNYFVLCSSLTLVILSYFLFVFKQSHNAGQNAGTHSYRRIMTFLVRLFWHTNNLIFIVQNF